MKKKLISIVTPCFNEEDNVIELSNRIKKVMLMFDQYDYEHIFIDNHSVDRTFELLKLLSKSDKRIKIIRNTRNFGHIRSPYYGTIQAGGDAVIAIASDLQEPPEVIPDMINAWESGYKIVMIVKRVSGDTFFLRIVKRLYYKALAAMSEIPILENAPGVGLFDSKVIEILRDFKEPYPYFRGLISEIGYPIKEIHYDQLPRLRGVSKNNLMSFYDFAMLGIINHSKVPLRMITIIGFIVGIFGLFVAIFFLLSKLFFWNTFQFGLAPILVGIFFFGGFQMFAIGLLAEYIFSIQIRVRNMPLVFEEERINF